MKSFISSIAILAVLGLGVGVAVQAQEASVTATVTVQNISLTVSDGGVTYGTLAVNTSRDTTTAGTGLDDSQTVTNNGNVNENFTIRGQNSGNWTLSATNAGTDNYVHEFCITGTGGSPDPCDATPVYTALTTSNQALVSSVAVSGTQLFDLRITTPNATANFGSQSVNVTVVATAA